tara:strand:- start:314 stop:511 length:198 start_codon:yes stop_codon:yes gene_type:complete
MTDILPSSLHYVLSELLTPNHPAFFCTVHTASLKKLNVPTLNRFLSRLSQILLAEQLGQMQADPM